MKLHTTLEHTQNVEKQDRNKIITNNQQPDFQRYEEQFKALGDQKRLEILYLLTQRGTICVCDLCEIFDMPQSKISYHLKILLNAGLIIKETKGTWSYYTFNAEEINHLLSEQLCCIFRPGSTSMNKCCSS